MTVVRYKGPPDSIRLGSLLVKIGDTIAAPNSLVQQLLTHQGFETIEEKDKTPAASTEPPKLTKKLKKKTSDKEK